MLSSPKFLELGICNLHIFNLFWKQSINQLSAINLYEGNTGT